MHKKKKKVKNKNNHHDKNALLWFWPVLCNFSRSEGKKIAFEFLLIFRLNGYKKKKEKQKLRKQK